MLEIIKKLNAFRFCLLEQYVKINSLNPFTHLPRHSVSRIRSVVAELFLL